MNFLKCIFCGNGPIKIFSVSSNGFAKTKCMNCGLHSPSDTTKKDKIKKPEVIYR